ncbi:MAG: ABC transporter permease [Erysipelotrichaceae bacterium]|jgi:ABC-2 type transport system permease protein|nr:ABC transporter permease [Erysipelotrichaceae bacterium]
MTVFKTCLRILRAIPGVFLLPFAVFMGILALLSFQYSYNPEQTSLTFTKATICVIDEDESALSQGLIEYLEKTTDYQGICEADYSDKVFYNFLDGALIIPKGYQENFNSNRLPVSALVYPGSTLSVMLEETVSSYLEGYRIYNKADLNVSNLQILEWIKADTDNTTKVEVLAGSGAADPREALAGMFSASTYVIIITVVSAIATLLIIFNQTQVKVRADVSGCNTVWVNTQKLLAGLLVGFATWLVCMAILYVLLHDYYATAYVPVILLNSFAMLLSSLGLAFMLGSIIKTPIVLNAFINIFALGGGFLSGSFVPQQFLDPIILLIARFLPQYWNVAANDAIVSANSVGAAWKALSIPLCVQILFGVVFALAGFVISRQKRRAQLV